MKSILDKSFKYRPSHATDVAATFKRVREQMKKQEEERQQKVSQLRRKNV